MAIKRLIFLASFIITVFLFVTIVLLSSVMEEEREDSLNDQFDRMTRDFNNMQILSMISETYGEEMVCLAFESKLRELDNYIWDLGDKIDKYRVASEEFYKDEYYVQQKELFNENEIYYFLLMRNMVEKCNMTKNNVLFFYKDSASCPKCDDQSFVLRDIRYLDDSEDRETAVFTFDMDLGLSSLELLEKYYEIDQYPCIVINEEKYCGIKSKEFVMEKICDTEEELNVCNKYYGK